MSDKKTYNISELAKEFDVTTRSIRFYDDEGLLHPTRNGLTRIFSSNDRVRLKLTLRGKRMGFSLAEIRELFSLRAESATGRAEQVLLAIELVERRCAQLEQQKLDAYMMETELDNHEARCREALAELRKVG